MIGAKNNPSLCRAAYSKNGIGHANNQIIVCKGTTLKGFRSFRIENLLNVY